MKFIYLLLIAIKQSYTQPCSPPVSLLVDSPILGECLMDNTENHHYTETELGTLNGLNVFTLSLWFRPDALVSGRTEHALFRVTADSSDVTADTLNGIRLGLFYSCNLDQATQIRIQYSKMPSTNAQSFVQNIPYLPEMWVFAAAGLSYPDGIVSYFAWQPGNPSMMINPQPITESPNFNSQLTVTSQIELMYWGMTYKRFCGQMQNVNWYPNYVEKGYLHNWLNLAIFTPTYSYNILATFTLEDGTDAGQYLHALGSGTVKGSLGASDTPEASADAEIDVDCLKLTNGKYATLPGISFLSDNKAFGVSLWFRANAIITGDGDSSDLTKDLVLLKRKYQGTTEVFGIMIYTTSISEYTVKIKSHNIVYSMNNIVLQKNIWHQLSVRVMYPEAVIELSNVMIDAVANEALYESHYITSLQNHYLEDTTDIIVLGDQNNQFSGDVFISHVQFTDNYIVYTDEDPQDTDLFIQCNSDCEVSINTLNTSQCLVCENGTFAQDGQCVASCQDGVTALTNSIIPNCKMCYFTCSSCLTNGDCTSCYLGYFLKDSQECVISADCLSNRVGDPDTQLCTLCGNGALDGVEECDDNNFVDGDGCSDCIIDNDYVCNGEPSICEFRCGDGVIDGGFGEQCDDGNYIDDDGCSNCMIDIGYDCSGQPSVCTKLCGNGTRAGGEGCDDGNEDDYDGCSSQCFIEPGYECNGITPDTCTKLCGNGIQDFGEECDDGNIIIGDGCSDCVVDRGWTCSNGICTQVCGNGVRDDEEECDDGNNIIGDGCSQCRIDNDYICVDGSETSTDKCTMIPEFCGDGIKKSTENCDDGNTLDNDGCSKQCQVEVGFICDGGSQYKSDDCYEICGDGRKIGIEECDDSNVYGGDGCNEQCKLEYLYQCENGICKNTCGNGVRDKNEQCDDENRDNKDGCSDYCKIELGYVCIYNQRDQCYKCSQNCISCEQVNTCDQCINGFYLLNNNCYVDCPYNYFKQDHRCESCIQGCQSCDNKESCSKCQYNYFLNQQDQLCYQKCPDQYYNYVDAINGNICKQCDESCKLCDQSTCFECNLGYYRNEEDKCTKCTLQNCRYCNEKICLECEFGYYDNDCKEIPEICGDGLHNPKEICDDGNTRLNDGCNDKCKVELNWSCILKTLQGPDQCYKQEPPQISTHMSNTHYNKFYLQFSRQLQPNIDFNNISKVIIPRYDISNFTLEEPPNEKGVVIQHDLSKLFVPYEYQIKQLNELTVEVDFQYYLTIDLNEKVMINITDPSKVIDIYNWTLIGHKPQQNTHNRLLQIDNYTNQSFIIVEGQLQYFIYYNQDEIFIIQIINWIIFTLLTIALLSALWYHYYIGEGKIFTIIDAIQYISILRFINWRYAYNLDHLFTILDYYNISFIYNYFQLFTPSHSSQTQPEKFTIYDYSSQYFLSGGGIYLSTLSYLLAIILLNELFYRLIKIQSIEYYTEVIHKFFFFNGSILFTQIMTFQFIISALLQLTYTDFESTISIVGFVIALLFILIHIALLVLILIKFVWNAKLTKVLSFYSQFGQLFDSLHFTDKSTKLFSVIPYLQKWATAILLIYAYQYPIIQTVGIFLIKIVPVIYYYYNQIHYFIEIQYKEIVYDSFVALMTLMTFLFYQFDSSKDYKLISGWVITVFLLLFVIFQLLWVRYAYKNIDKLQPPDVPEHEQVQEEDQEEQQQQQRRKKIVAESSEKQRKKKKKVEMSNLQQAQKMEQLEADFFGNVK